MHIKQMMGFVFNKTKENVMCADLSIVPLRRMALFQSFRVDFPAKHTNSFGLMSCSLNCLERKYKLE